MEYGQSDQVGFLRLNYFQKNQNNACFFRHGVLIYCGGRKTQAYIRVWRSLVSRLNGVQEASSSNLDTRTNKTERASALSVLFIFGRGNGICSMCTKNKPKIWRLGRKFTISFHPFIRFLCYTISRSNCQDWHCKRSNYGQYFIFSDTEGYVCLCVR